MIYRNLPAGVQDVLPEECRALTAVRERLQNLFLSYGFQPVRSASLEYYDSYSQISNAIPQEKMFKLMDTDGRLLVLRPDVTLSISRIAATKLSQPQERLFYFGDKWDLENAGGISIREIAQAGVECLGEQGAFSDAQAVACAIEALKAAGVQGFIIDIGHVGFFKGILEECGLNETAAEAVRRYVNAKDGMNAERILRREGINGDSLNSVLALPALFGGAEVFDVAAQLTANRAALDAIAHLKRIYGILSDMGYSDCICFDLGTVKSLSYYSGMVFSGLVKELGAPLLSGGRYDNLADDFGKHIPAVGFAIGLKRLLIALERQGGLPAEGGSETVVVCEEGHEGEAYRLVEKVRKSGGRATLSPVYGEAGVSEAQKRGGKVVFVDRNGTVER